MTTDNTAAEQRIDLDGIPVVYLEPPDGSPTAPIALWLTHLSGTKESELPALRALAAAGHPAVSFDPPGHGERTTKSNSQVMEWFLAGFRRRMWPLLGLYTLETLRVLDWSAAKLGSHRDFVIGGVSLGGDVAVTVASLDTRVVRVAGLRVDRQGWSSTEHPKTARTTQVTLHAVPECPHTKMGGCVYLHLGARRDDPPRR